MFADSLFRGDYADTIFYTHIKDKSKRQSILSCVAGREVALPASSILHPQFSDLIIKSVIC